MCSNCSGEMSFSKLKRIKNEFRSSPSQQCLNHLSLMSIESQLLRKQNFDKLIHKFACKRARQVLLYSECLTWSENERFRTPELVIGQKFSFSLCMCYLPFSSGVSECVLSRDEQEYYGDTMRHCFLLKRWGPSKKCASEPLKALCGTESNASFVEVVSCFGTVKATIQ